MIPSDISRLNCETAELSTDNKMDGCSSNGLSSFTEAGLPSTGGESQNTAISQEGLLSNAPQTVRVDNGSTCEPAKVCFEFLLYGNCCIISRYRLPLTSTLKCIQLMVNPKMDHTLA